MFKFVINLSIWVLLIAVSQSQAKKVQVTELTNSWTLKDSESGRYRVWSTPTDDKLQQKKPVLLVSLPN